MGVDADSAKPGYAFVAGLIRLMDETGCRYLKMSDYGVKEDDFQAIVDMTVEQVGIDLDRYTLAKEDFLEMLKNSYR